MARRSLGDRLQVIWKIEPEAKVNEIATLS
jgi:hypothetical protein